MYQTQINMSALCSSWWFYGVINIFGLILLNILFSSQEYTAFQQSNQLFLQLHGLYLNAGKVNTHYQHLILLKYKGLQMQALTYDHMYFVKIIL